MKKHSIGIIMNGVTGRMGTNQHYIRSILAIRKQGGVKISDDEVIWPEPVLVGRSVAKLQALAAMDSGVRYTTTSTPNSPSPRTSFTSTPRRRAAALTR